jgi:3',5'-cyclic AMP phosphodiesterase CpdA
MQFFARCAGMARLIHLSDLHFGAHDPRLVEAVEERVDEAKPDLVVVSGDFTQRARTEQFEEACQFLTRLRDRGHELLGVPGNHDVPLYDVLRRFLSPLTRYKRYIDETLCPFHQVKGAAVLGINTARSLTFKDGRINREQMEFIRSTFARVGDVPRILVTHHPMFALPVSDGPELGKAIGRQEDALDAVGEAGVDILLAGHNHRASTHSARDLATRAGPALVIQAGTATSTRLRDEEQSFNQIDIEGLDVVLTVQTWGGSGFVAGDAQGFRREGDHWRPIAKTDTAVETDVETA